MKYISKLLSGLVILAIIGVSTASAGIQNRDIDLLPDGDQEKSGTASYSSLNSPTLSKQTGTVDGRGVQVLRVARNASDYYYAVTSSYGSGTYRLTGYTRSDGTAVPRVAVANGLDFIGTSSTSWQRFDITTTSTTGVVYLGSTTLGAGYVEFDNVTFTKYYGTIQNRDVNLVNDGNMDMVGTASFAAQNGATLSKIAGGADVYGTQYMRVTSSGANGRAVISVPVVAGKTYRYTGWCRSDATTVAKFNFIGFYTSDKVLCGANWTYFDYTEIALFSTYVALINQNGTAGYSEWDNVSVTPYYGTVHVK